MFFDRINSYGSRRGRKTSDLSLGKVKIKRLYCGMPRNNFLSILKEKVILFNFNING